MVSIVFREIVAILSAVVSIMLLGTA